VVYAVLIMSLATYIGPLCETSWMPHGVRDLRCIRVPF